MCTATYRGFESLPLRQGALAGSSPDRAPLSHEDEGSRFAAFGRQVEGSRFAAFDRELAGEMTEWLKVHDWKSCVLRKRYRGFKSRPLRHRKRASKIIPSGVAGDGRVLMTGSS